MSEDITNNQEPRGVESPPRSFVPATSLTGKPVSVMRKFLESGVDFSWPDHVGRCSGNHCVFNNAIELDWIRRIPTTSKALIDVYRGRPNYIFQEAFVVKTILDSDPISNNKTRAAREVENMKDLRHPHVAALLGTYLHLDRLSILIFPAARCDLEQFLASVSKELKSLCGEHLHHSSDSDDPSDGSHSPGSTISADDPLVPASKSRDEASSHNYKNAYPLNLSFPEKIDHLRRYFVCLSQALNYIHESDVRHKDVKPANVLIDSSGSVILTDFGISRRFPKSTSHVTNDKWDLTRKYASPEIMKGKKVPRGDPSDVFSLGCVFLEMVTLILKKDLDDFCAFYSRDRDDAYYCHLAEVHQWIDNLEGLERPTNTSTFDVSLTQESVEGLDCMPDLDQPMMGCLATIRRMLIENPSNRPADRGLWIGFQSLSPHVCDDCDERNENRWKPNIRQKQNTESGVSARRSQHKTHGPEPSRHQSSRLFPEALSGEHYARQQRAPLAMHKQPSSMHPPESVLNGSSSNQPDRPQVPGASRPSFPEERRRHVEPRNITQILHHESEPINLNNLSPVNPATGPSQLRMPESSPYSTPLDFSSTESWQVIGKGSRKIDETIHQNRTPSEEALHSMTPILVYDMEAKHPYSTVFKSLKGA